LRRVLPPQRRAIMLNRITIHGYLGNNPELTEHQGPNGPFKKATFSVGVSRDYGDETDWFRCSIIGKRAEVIEKWFRKGSQILVVGRMESYKPKNNPDSKAWSVIVTDFDFCDKNTNSDGSSAKPAEPEPIPTTPTDDEDIPF